MFTGIVAAVGRIEAVTPLGSPADDDTGVRLTVASGGLDLADVELGDSISIQGACMTVIEKSAESFGRIICGRMANVENAEAFPLILSSLPAPPSM